MRTVIIDDERLTRELIKEILISNFKEIEIVGEADSYETSLELLANEEPELLLLDIDLGDKTIFDVLEKSEIKNARIIFITAHSNYALKAIKFSAFDFILKPVVPSELIETVQRAYQLTQEEQMKRIAVLHNNLQNPQKIVLKTSDKMHIVELNDIVYCEADNNYTIFHLTNEKSLVLSKSLKVYEEMLSDSSFYRVHQSYLVNINAITAFEKNDGGHLLMSNGKNVPVSITKKKRLLNYLQSIYKS
jgi:two-component system LytT family response regulator